MQIETFLKRLLTYKKICDIISYKKEEETLRHYSPKQNNESIGKLKHDVEEKDFKRVEIKFEPKNEKQAEAWNGIDDNVITFLIGSVGSGKTRIATTKALSLFETGKYNQIVLLRSASVSKSQQLGFLKGTLDEKIQPLLLPMKASFEKVITKNQYEKMVSDGKIFPYALAYLEGLSFEKSIVILDECQNVDLDTLKMVMTRISDNCKLLICGDRNQIKLDNPEDSCILTIARFVNKKGIQIFEFRSSEIVRGRITRVVNSCFETEEDANDTYIAQNY